MTVDDHRSSLVQIMEVLESEPVWVIRAAADPGFAPDLLTKAVLERFQRAARSLPDLDGSEVREALEELLLVPDPRTGLAWLVTVGAMELVLPEVQATLHLSQEAGRLHKDVWAHTMQVVFQSPARPAVRWAALLHDIGKVHTRSIGERGKVQFLGHAEKGAAMFRRISRRLDFPENLAGTIHFLVLKHLRASAYDESWNDSAVRRFYKEVGEHLEDLLDLSRADITTGRAAKKAQALRMIDELMERIAVLRVEDEKVAPLPAGLGNQIMERFALAPGPLIGRIRRLLEEAVENGELEPRQSAEHYLGFLETHRARWPDGQR